MLILILLCFAAAIILALLRGFSQPPPPGRHLGWIAFACLALAFLIEYAVKLAHGG